MSPGVFLRKPWEGVSEALPGHEGSMCHPLGHRGDPPDGHSEAVLQASRLPVVISGEQRVAGQCLMLARDLGKCPDLLEPHV